MVVEVVNVAIRPDQRERWLDLVKTNAVRTRAEPGCLSFQVTEDLENPNSFVLVEHWSDLEAQYDHFRNPEFGKLMASLGDLLASPPEVSIHEVSSTQTLDEALAAAGVSS